MLAFGGKFLVERSERGLLEVYVHLRTDFFLALSSELIFSSASSLVSILVKSLFFSFANFAAYHMFGVYFRSGSESSRSFSHAEMKL